MSHQQEEKQEKEQVEVELDDVNPNENTRTKEAGASMKEIQNMNFSGIDFESILHKVEWSTLLFFGCLFIFMKSLEELGLLDYLGNLISDLIKVFIC
jgi:hypothetical protein